jgi:hypothetical protein
MGVRYTIVYPEDGSPSYIKGGPDDPGERPRPHKGVTVMPDLPDFVSPIDQKLYSGRAGMREHNKRHDVVPNEDLKGLPTLTSRSDQRPPEKQREYAENRKRDIINQVNPLYRKYNG